MERRFGYLRRSIRRVFNRPRTELPYSNHIKNGCISLRILERVMCTSPSLFSKIFENITDVTYDHMELATFSYSLMDFPTDNVKLFVEKFQDVSEDLVKSGLFCYIMSGSLQYVRSYKIDDLKKSLDIFLYNSRIINKLGFVDPKIDAIADWCGCLPVYKESSVISEYVKTFGGYHYFNEEEVTERVLLMVSSGLGVTLIDLDTIYKCYGYCELFRILLHRDIIVDGFKRIDVSSIVLIYCDATVTILDCLEDFSSFPALLKFYNNTILKNACLMRSQDEELITRVKNMPQVPSLIELSRNVAREYIVKKYEIKNSKQFLFVLSCLPIDKVSRRIILLEEELY